MRLLMSMIFEFRRAIVLNDLRETDKANTAFE